MKTRKYRIKVFFLLIALMSFWACEKSVETEETKRNVVFILVDDLGWTDLGCYGSSFYETKNIDELAKESTRFTDAYAASPVCSPTRAALLTGLYPTRLQITDWIPGDDPKDGPLLGPRDKNALDLKENTLAESMKSAGYKTFFAGKWHLGHQDHFPEKQGFDINRAGHHMGQPPNGYYVPYKIDNLPDGPDGEYLTDRLTDESINFIDQNKDEPFFLYLSYYTVHTPIEACNRHLPHYQQKLAAMSFATPTTEKEGASVSQKYQMDPAYASMVHAMDENVGRIIAALERNGLDENTLVVFTSDNGGLSTAGWTTPTSVKPLRAGKGWCYEGGIRVPLLIKAPWLKQKSVSDEPVISMDLFPTILKLTKNSTADSILFDGQSLTPLLTDRNEEFKRSSIYWHYPHYHSSGWVPGAAIRMGDWKLVEYYHEPKTELYNLKDDISESNNLYKEHPKKVIEMQKELMRLQNETKADFPLNNPSFKIDSTETK